MSANFAVQSLVDDTKGITGMMEQFLDVCPDEIWASTFGGYPVWQNYYHAVECVFLFLKDTSAPAPMFDQDVFMLNPTNVTPPSRQAMKERAQIAHTLWLGTLERLSDADLLEKTEFFKNTTAMASLIAKSFGHYQYHFGQCDAALRHNGLKGIYG